MSDIATPVVTPEVAQAAAPEVAPKASKKRAVKADEAETRTIVTNGFTFKIQG